MDKLLVLSICLPESRGHEFNPWSRKIPHCHRATEPVSQLLSLRSRASELQLLKPTHLSLCSATRKPSQGNEDTMQPITMIIKNATCPKTRLPRIRLMYCCLEHSMKRCFLQCGIVSNIRVTRPSVLLFYPDQE